MDQRFEKLPVWTKKYIECLREEIFRLTYDLNERKASEEPTKTIIDDNSYAKLKHYLKDNVRVKFVFGPKEYRDFIEVTRKREGLQLYTGGAEIFYSGSACNMARVRIFND